MIRDAAAVESPPIISKIIMFVMQSSTYASVSLKVEKLQKGSLES
jgi:hypothetical protein